LVEHELGEVIDVLGASAPGCHGRWLILVLAEEAPDLATNRSLGRCPVGPVDRQVFPDALDEVSRDSGELRVDVARVGAAGLGSTLPALSGISRRLASLASSAQARWPRLPVRAQRH
jgi:hypothetical protein